jgi:hypothetical protein
MENEKKNLIVLFPGRGYTVDMPLLYYAEFKYYVKGYESLKINYGDCLKSEKPFPEIVEDIKIFVLEQIKEVDFSVYDDILFVSKSLGTVLAGWLAERLNIKNIRHIYLTPIYDTMEFIKKGKNISIVIAGTKDTSMNAKYLKEDCDQEEIRVELIEGATHGLGISGDMNASIDILKRVVELY